MEDLRTFLESGLLETYATGQGTTEERALVEEMVARHPEVKAELQSIEQVLENFALANAVPPPPGLKQQILKAIEQESSTKTTPPTPQIKGSNGRLLLFQWLSAALFAGVVALAWLLGKVQNENTALKNTQLELEKQITDCKRSEQTQEIYAFLRAPETRSVELKNERSRVRVYHNAAAGVVAFDLSTLEPAPNKAFYQLWAIVEGEPPLSLGMVQTQTLLAWQNVSFNGKAVAFAVSLEDKPEGNPQPTQVFMAGNVGS